jgi:nicotinamide mononucleotide transporter
MLTEAFALWGAPVTWLEIVAFGLSVAMVLCNMRVLHWGWPLGLVASVLYGWLFAHSKLYGEAALQLFFAAMSLWGWWQWLRGRTAAGAALAVRRATAQVWAVSLASAAACVLTVGWFLSRYTDSDVPWLDAAPTGLSVVAQVLLGRKWVANWWLWAVVNALSVGLFAYKGLYLTVLLYALFTVLSVIGGLQWQRIADASSKR